MHVIPPEVGDHRHGSPHTRLVGLPATADHASLNVHQTSHGQLRDVIPRIESDPRDRRAESL